MENKHSILIIDDNTKTIGIIHSIISNTITDNIICCTDIEKGLRICKEKTLDLVIFKTYGNANFAKRLSDTIKDNKKNKTTFLLISQKASDEVNCSGVDLYMKCPIVPKHLVASVKTLLRLKDLDDLFLKEPKREEETNIFYLKKMLHEKLPQISEKIGL